MKANSLGSIHCCGALAAAAFTALAWLSHVGGNVNVWWFLALLSLAWAAVLGAFLAARNVESNRRLLGSICGWAVVMRVIGFVGEPVLEDDYFRYLWDGWQFAQTGNPYATAPAQHFADESLPDRFQTILNNVNYPAVPTIYGPVCEYVFLLGHWIAPGQLWPIKLILIVADLATLALLLRMTSARNALLYAWCPLLIKEVAFTAHPEILGVAFVVGALKAAQPGRAKMTAALCACAVAARVQAILFVPFLFWFACALERSPVRRGNPDGFRFLRVALWFVFVFAGTLALLYAPFWAQGSSADLAGLRAFLGEWEFNSSLFALVKFATNFQTSRIVCALLFVLFYLAWFLHMNRRHTVGRDVVGIRGDVIFGAFLLCSAVVNPWYLLWLLPFVALRPSITGITGLAAVSLSYLSGANLGWAEPGLYDHPKWLRPLEYGLVLAAALFDWRRNLFAAKRKTG